MRLGVRALGLEGELAALLFDVDHDRVTCNELCTKDALGELILDFALDRAAQRTCTERGVVPQVSEAL